MDSNSWSFSYWLALKLDWSYAVSKPCGNRLKVDGGQVLSGCGPGAGTGCRRRSVARILPMEVVPLLLSLW